MIGDRDLLERAAERFVPEPGIVERVLRRRDRRRRSQRIVAGVVAAIVAVGAVAGLVNAFRGADRPHPVGPPSPFETVPTWGHDGGAPIAVGPSGIFTAIDTLPGRSSTGSDVRVTRYDFSGVPSWTRVFGGSGDDNGTALALTGDALYVVGQDRFGRDRVTMTGQPSSGMGIGFVARLDLDGTLVWSRTFGRGRWSGAGDVAVDDSGIYVLGNVESPAASLVKKYSFDGDELWTIGVPGTELGQLAAGPGGFYVATTTHTGQAGRYQEDAVLLRFDRDGRELWRHLEDRRGPDESYSGVTIAPDGGALVTGESTRPLEGQGAPGSGAFVQRFAADGSLLWTRGFEGVEPPWPAAIATDSDRVYVPTRLPKARRDEVDEGLFALVMFDLDGHGRRIVGLDAPYDGGEWTFGISVSAGIAYVAFESGPHTSHADLAGDWITSVIQVPIPGGSA